MTCPYCKYEYLQNDWNREKKEYKTVIGDENFSYLSGDFREEYKPYPSFFGYDKRDITIRICPKCGVLFKQ